MGKLIRVDFRSGRRLSPKGHSGPVDPRNREGVIPFRRPKPRGVELSIPWDQNPYNDCDMLSLMQESMRFGSVVENHGGVVDAELCRWAIALYEAIAYQAHTDEFRVHAQSVSFRLRQELDQLQPPDGAA